MEESMSHIAVDRSPHRSSWTLGLIVTAAAIAAAVIAGTAAPAAAGPLTDAGTLQPPRPPGTVCRDDGPWTICRRETVDSWTLVPIFHLPCGQLYETAAGEIDARRWYLDGKLVKRRVTQSAQAAWGLSPTGAGADGRREHPRELVDRPRGAR